MSRPWIVCFALLAAASVSRPARAVDHDALKKIVIEQCVPHMQAGNGPAPCAAVDIAGGSAVLKDIRGKTQFLLIPTKVGDRDRRPADPGARHAQLLASGLGRAKIRRGAGGPRDPARGCGLAINSAYGRSQYQLHIHVDCIRPDVKQALQANLPKIGPVWADLDVDLAGHRYRAMRIDGKDLSAKDPFRLLADSDPAVRTDMKRQTLAAVAAAFPDGKPGFILLNDRANIAALDFASSSNLLDQDCAVLN